MDIRIQAPIGVLSEQLSHVKAQIIDLKEFDGNPNGFNKDHLLTIMDNAEVVLTRSLEDVRAMNKGVERTMIDLSRDERKNLTDILTRARQSYSDCLKAMEIVADVSPAKSSDRINKTRSRLVPQ